MRHPSNRTNSLALVVLGAIAGLACVSAIGAVATLVVMAATTEPEVVVAHERDCVVVAWQSGETHCFRSAFAGSGKPGRDDLAVVTQAGSGR